MELQYHPNDCLFDLLLLMMLLRYGPAALPCSCTPSSEDQVLVCDIFNKRINGWVCIPASWSFHRTETTPLPGHAIRPQRRLLLIEVAQRV